ncbi:fungal-specific transcription factor domain-containing protein [Mycena sp. CBHHK59/15]|nr:fungal-specific transcription factor domain-containing protein [Mycena sp. CBHHK59/15]
MSSTRLFQFSNLSDDSESLDGQTADRTYSSKFKNVLKSSGACVHCKSLKVRCKFNPGETICQRCQAGNYECLARSRKKRKPAPTHEDLQEKAHEQDRQIQELLMQFDQMRMKSKMQRLMSSPAHSIASRHSNLHPSNSSPELAAASCFSQGHDLSQLVAPEIVKCCYLYPAEIMDLFAIFFERINPFFSILDPDLHGNPANVIWTCPFLFTVICATASRFYTLRPSLYQTAHSLARDAAAKALIDGSRSVDVCQAYLLLGVYPVPKKKFVDDRSWLFMGVSIRMAIELELNQPSSVSVYGERESLNRTRTWLNCYCVDGSHAIQFGKMPMLSLDDYVARTSRDWYNSSPMNSPFDVHLCGYVHLIHLMSEWRKTVEEGQARHTNFNIITSSIQTQYKLSQEMAAWCVRYDRELALKPFPICAYRGDTSQMIAAYLRLVVLADGFQHATRKGLSRDSEILRLSIDEARTVIQIVLDRLYPTGNLRYAMDANFLYVSFASAFVVNLLRPKFLPLVKEETQRDIVHLVSRLIDVLGSDSVALDGRHTPALYSRFLSSLLAKYNVFPPRNDSPSSDDVKFCPQFGTERTHTPPHTYSWPDIAHSVDVSPPGSESSDDFLIYHHSGDPEMDLSLNHFIRTVTQERHVGDGYVLPGNLDLWDPTWSMPGDVSATGYV